MNKKERKKSSKKGAKAKDGPGSLADITKESQMSVIAVYGDALDKLGFDLARKANRNAEKRLTKTLNVYDNMASKDDARYRKEKYELREKLNKLRLNQQRVWREYATRGANEVGTTATGVLFRRARVLERSGVLEEEQEQERQVEAEMRAEATRRLVESRTQMDRVERVVDPVDSEHENGHEQGGAWEKTSLSDYSKPVSRKTFPFSDSTPQMLSKNVSCDNVELPGAHWINPEDLSDEGPFQNPESGHLLGEYENEVNGGLAVPDVLVDAQEDYDENVTEGDPTVLGEIPFDNVTGNLNGRNGRNHDFEEEDNYPEQHSDTEFEFTLKRMHTSPSIAGKARTIQSADAAKRRARSTVTLPYIVVDSSSQYASSDNVFVGTHSGKDEDDSNDTDHSQPTEQGPKKLLPQRKQRVQSNVIQPAYFRSQSAKIKTQSPSNTLTPPQIRRCPQDNSKARRKPSTKVRRISVPAKTPSTSVETENISTPKNHKKLTAKMRRVSTTNAPNPAELVYSRSPSLSPSLTPSPEVGTNPNGISHVESRSKMKEKFLLESKLYVPKASKNERRVLVPDKQEMLLILEEQKQELQSRIDRFLTRQIRRSKLERK